MNAEDEVEALAALHATTDVMLQERAAAELELLQEAILVEVVYAEQLL